MHVPGGLSRITFKTSFITRLYVAVLDQGDVVYFIDFRFIKGEISMSELIEFRAEKTFNKQSLLTYENSNSNLARIA